MEESRMMSAFAVYKPKLQTEVTKGGQQLKQLSYTIRKKRRMQLREKLQANKLSRNKFFNNPDKKSKEECLSTLLSEYIVSPENASLDKCWNVSARTAGIGINKNKKKETVKNCETASAGNEHLIGTINEKPTSSHSNGWKSEDTPRPTKSQTLVFYGTLNEKEKISNKNCDKFKNVKSALKKQDPMPLQDFGDTTRKPIDFLEYIITPIKSTYFFNTHWEKKYAYVSRNGNDHFKNILSSEKLDHMLRENVLHYTKNVDVVTYENGERLTHNPEGRALPANVWDYYLNGCSVRILNPQTYNIKLRKLVCKLQEYFGAMVGVNVYLTPPGSQGFAPHYDDIEAFVIQLEGHKNWKLYPPIDDGQELPRLSSRNFKRMELGRPMREVTLTKGDTLYFPRGVIHEASTDANEHSLHITVSVYQNTSYVDLLEKLLPQVLKRATQSDIRFRHGLPIGYLKHVGEVNSDKITDQRCEILKTTTGLVRSLVEHAAFEVDKAADQLGRKLMYDALPPQLAEHEKQRSCSGDGERMKNGEVTNRGCFWPDTLIRFTRFYSQRLAIEDDVAKIYYCTENANVYHGEEEQYLLLDNDLVDAIKALHTVFPKYISIEDLPANDGIKKMQLVSDLWERGLIITKESLPIEDD